MTSESTWKDHQLILNLFKSVIKKRKCEIVSDQRFSRLSENAKSELFMEHSFFITSLFEFSIKGNLKHYRECHIGGFGDWLLVYENREKDMVLYLVGTGTHANLFGL